MLVLMQAKRDLNVDIILSILVLGSRLDYEEPLLENNVSTELLEAINTGLICSLEFGIA